MNDEFYYSLGYKPDKDELRRIIKEKEKQGYFAMSRNEAERYMAREKKNYSEREKVKEYKKVDELLKRNGFI